MPTPINFLMNLRAGIAREGAQDFWEPGVVEREHFEKRARPQWIAPA
jgi:hypothetical protein